MKLSQSFKTYTARPSSYPFKKIKLNMWPATRSSGALAQLGERLICIQEVNGSIPLGSTSSKAQHGYDRNGSVAQVVRAYA